MCVCQAATGSVPVANQDATCSGKECEARPMQKQTLARIQKLSEGIEKLEQAEKVQEKWRRGHLWPTSPATLCVCRGVAWRRVPDPERTSLC